LLLAARGMAGGGLKICVLPGEGGAREEEQHSTPKFMILFFMLSLRILLG